MKKLVPLTMSRLQNLEVGQHVKSVLKGIDDLGSGLVTDSVLQQYLAKIAEASQLYDKALLKTTKSDETLKISNADMERDKAITAFQRQLSVYELSEDDTELDAYTSLNTLMKTYKNIQRWNLEEESNGIDNLIEDLSAGKYTAHIATLHMQNLQDRVKSTNEKFKTVFTTRTNESVHTEYYDTKALREDLTLKYQVMTEYVLNLSIAHDSDTFNKPLDVINVVRKYYADLIAKRKGGQKGESETTIPPME